MRSGRWEGELVHTARDGRRLVVASRWALQRDGRGRAAAILETNNDITERRQIEDGLVRAQGELAHVARVATLGELTASIAHEVNQPLAAVVTNGEACLRWLGRAVPDIGQARSSVEHMIRNGQRASEVVRRLRALSRKSDPSYAPVSLVDVVNDVALLIGRELQVHRTTLTVNTTGSLPSVRGDRVQLQQVVMNLLMNGIQAMDGVGDRPRRLGVEVGRSTRSRGRRADRERCRSRHRSRQPQPPVRRLLHHAPGWHGHGPVDLPLDRRGPWRPHLGDQP